MPMVYCICGNTLYPTLGEIYGGSINPRKTDFVYCNNCLSKISSRQIIYHCDTQSIAPHKNGYDLCQDCHGRILLNAQRDIAMAIDDDKIPLQMSTQDWQCRKCGMMTPNLLSNCFVCNTPQKDIKFTRPFRLISQVRLCAFLSQSILYA